MSSYFPLNILIAYVCFSQVSHRESYVLAENFISPTLWEKNAREAGGAQTGDERSTKSRARQMAYPSENESENDILQRKKRLMSWTVVCMEYAMYIIYFFSFITSKEKRTIVVPACHMRGLVSHACEKCRIIFQGNRDKIKHTLYRIDICITHWIKRNLTTVCQKFGLKI